MRSTLLLVSVLVAIVLAGVVFRSREVAPKLDLFAQDEGSRITINWSRDNALVAKAKVGILQIHDGQETRKIFLTPQEIGDGRILYRPETDDVSFQLELYSVDGGSISQSLRLLGSTRKVIQQPIPVAEPIPDPVPTTSARVRVEAPPKPKAFRPLQLPMLISPKMPDTQITLDAPSVELPGGAPVDGLYFREPDMPHFAAQPVPVQPPKPIIQIYQPPRILGKIIMESDTMDSIRSWTRKTSFLLRLQIGSDGHLKSASMPEQLLSPPLQEALTNAVRRVKFAPATRGGVPTVGEINVLLQTKR